MADLGTGTMLGDRFEVVGVLGRGGMATVYLVQDRLREERVALKVLHGHLAGDPAMRARLRREVQAAARLRHPGALVAHELHEVDGHLALSMPFHSGRTLAETLATDGPLSPEQVRRLGQRLTEVLADAHRHGVLHRDITPGNVMLDAHGEAVISDFGLARLDGGTARSTGLLGTAGYTAPEVYEGARADPRSDLYGLGCVLYQAATGRAPFAADHPAGVLQRQLESRYTPIRDVRPEVPSWLAETIERLLVADPELRPRGADAVHAAFASREAPALAEPTPSALPVMRPTLPPGEWVVLVRERSEHHGRRRVHRARRRRDEADLGVVFHEIGGHIKNALMGLAGMEAGLSPEERLTRAVAVEAGLPEEALAVPDEVYEKRFLLVRGVERETARRLVDNARQEGFRAHLAPERQLRGPNKLLAAWPVLIAIMWAALFPMLMSLGAPQQTVFVFVGLTIFLAAVVGPAARRRALPATWKRLPIAFPTDLGERLTDEARAALPVASQVATEAPIVAAAPTRGSLLEAKAISEIEALAGLIEDPALGLSDPAVADMRATVAQLREQALELRAEVDRLDAELSRAESEASGTDYSWLAGRLGRLDTLARAGEPVDAGERARLEATLTSYKDCVDAAQALETRLTAAVARLLEIASTATRARRELLADVDVARSADRLARELRDQAKASAMARDELKKAAARRRETT